MMIRLELTKAKLERHDNLAIDFLKQPTDGRIDGYLRGDGAIVRFDTQTGVFGIGYPGAEIETFFKAKYNKKTGRVNIDSANEYFNQRKKWEQSEEFDESTHVSSLQEV